MLIFYPLLHTMMICDAFERNGARYLVDHEKLLFKKVYDGKRTNKMIFALLNLQGKFKKGLKTLQIMMGKQLTQSSQSH